MTDLNVPSTYGVAAPVPLPPDPEDCQSNALNALFAEMTEEGTQPSTRRVAAHALHSPDQEERVCTTPPVAAHWTLPPSSECAVQTTSNPPRGKAGKDGLKVRKPLVHAGGVAVNMRPGTPDCPSNCRPSDSSRVASGFADQRPRSAHASARLRHNNEGPAPLPPPRPQSAVPQSYKG